jgi:hypothetical protein
MNVILKYDPANASKVEICKTLLISMTDAERKDFFNCIYSMHVDKDNISAISNDLYCIRKFITAHNNDIDHIAEAVRIILVAALSNEDKMIKEGLLKQAYEEMTKTTNFDKSPFD